MSRFLERLTTLVVETPVLRPADLPYVRPAFEDTLAITYAGWGEPETRIPASVYLGEALPAPHELDGNHPEAAALLIGAASHALEFDDFLGFTHPSSPLVAGLVGAIVSESKLAHRAVSAFGVGLAVNIGVRRALGMSHYEKGWHGTSTVAPLSVAAAVSYLYGLDATKAGRAQALAAAMAGGLQRNFGAMAKSFQAGQSAAAGVRAARLARAGLTANDDIFGPKGYFDLYRAGTDGEDPDAIEFDIHAGGLSAKLYPCTLSTHRPIEAAFAVREILAARGLTAGDVAAYRVIAAPGTFRQLRVVDPQNGSEAQFCGPYVLACALLDGSIGLQHFDASVLQRPDVRALMPRIEFAHDASMPAGGAVRLTALDGSGGVIAEAEKTVMPGSPQAPLTREQVEMKARDCLAHYERRTGQHVEYETFVAFVDRVTGHA
jgi:2-methylcitrate dehydratase PrpD